MIENLQELQAAAEELERIKQQNRDRAARYLDRRKDAGKRQISAILHQDAYEEINRRRERSHTADEPLTAGQIIEQALLATKDFIKLDGTIDIDLISDMAEAYDKYMLSDTVNINDNINKQNEIKHKNTKDNVNDSFPYCTVTPDDDIHINDCLECSNALIHEDEPEIDTMAPDQEETPEKNKETLQSLDVSEYDLQNLSIDDRDKIIFQVYELYPGRQQAQLRVDLLNQNEILFNGNPWTKKQFTDQLSRARDRMKTRQEK